VLRNDANDCSARAISSASKGEQKTFRVRCLGLCREINVHLEVAAGDADLYAREDGAPSIVNR